MNLRAPRFRRSTILISPVIPVPPRGSAAGRAFRDLEWEISSARTQWGSCSREGRVRLNWRLVHFEPAVIDYVIAHELAHLRELNHSPRFWNEVARLLPGYEAARDRIRRVEIAALSF